MAIAARAVPKGETSLPEQSLSPRSNGSRRQAEQVVEAIVTVALARECSQKLAQVLGVHFTVQGEGTAACSAAAAQAAWNRISRASGHPGDREAVGWVALRRS